jgi:peptidyl-prolyl cis-trans isomerase A (cyclophilin A)
MAMGRPAVGPATVLAAVLEGAVAAAVVLATPAQSAVRAALTNPSALKDTAPAMYRVLLETSAGMAVILVHREWAPHGADRFYTLVKHGFYDNCRFFRVIPKFVAQFGIHGDPAVAAAWSHANLPVDRSRQSNRRGRVTFAMETPETRTTQVFINFGDNSKLDIDGFAPFGEVVSSMVLVEQIYSGYGEGPDQARIQMEGNAFLMRDLPRLDYIRRATIEP